MPQEWHGPLAKAGARRNLLVKEPRLVSARILSGLEPSFDAECSEFIFLWWQGEEYGAIVGRQSLEFLQRFYGSIGVAETWGEFMGALGESGTAFVKVFSENDERQVGDQERLADVRESVWILYDDEFPITQIVEETYTFFGEHFPEEDGFLDMTTEYGRPYRLYPKSRFVEMVEHFGVRGLGLGALRSPFPKGLHDYGPSR